MIKAMIIDLDGTLLDSMHIWDGLGTDYIISKGKIPKESRQSLTKELAQWTMQESAYMLKSRYHLHETVEKIIEDLYAMILNKYVNEIPLKKGVLEFIQMCKQHQIRLCIFTANNYKNAYAALTHNKIQDEFEFIISTEDDMITKRKPEGFLKVQQKLHVKKEECVVIEDALHAIVGAKEAGLEVYGIYDESAQNEWKEIKEKADKTFYDFIELEEWLCKQF